MASIIKKIFNNGPGIVLAYILLALFFTFPLILNITDSMAAGKNKVDNEYTINSDAMYFVWNFWLFKYNLIDLGKSPFSHTEMVFYPNGFDINSAGNDNLLNSVISVPLQLATKNLILIYNFLVIFNFVFAAYAAYLLIYHLTGDKKISFLGGIIFGFSPYMIARSLGHFNLITTGGIPLFVLMFLKMLQKPGAKSGIFAAAAFAIASFGAWQYGLFGIIFVFFSFAYYAIYRRERILNKNYVKSFIVFIVAVSAIIAPVAFPMIRGYLNRNMIPPPFSDTTLYSASLLSYFIPSPLSNFLGNLIKPDLFKSFSVYLAESVTYLGLLEIAVLIFYARNRKKFGKEGNYWLFLIIIFFILSLGPYLKLSLPSLIFDKIPLPYYFVFKYIPFFNFAREPARLSIFIMLFAAVIFSLALKYLLAHNSFSLRKQKIILLAAALMIIAERMALPYPIEKIKMPDFYKTLAPDRENYAILDLPVDVTMKFSLYNLYQTAHRKKIISGDIMPNAFTPETYAYVEKNDFLINSTCLIEPAGKKKYDGIKTDADREKIIKEFKDIKIKYAVIHKTIIQQMDEGYDGSGKKQYDCGTLKNNIKELFADTPPAYEDELIKVYAL